MPAHPQPETPRAGQAAKGVEVYGTHVSGATFTIILPETWTKTKLIPADQRLLRATDPDGNSLVIMPIGMGKTTPPKDVVDWVVSSTTGAPGYKPLSIGWQGPTVDEHWYEVGPVTYGSRIIFTKGAVGLGLSVRLQVVSPATRAAAKAIVKSFSD